MVNVGIHISPIRSSVLGGNTPASYGKVRSGQNLYIMFCILYIFVFTILMACLAYCEFVY